jgi:hypothetical protein
LIEGAEVELPAQWARSVKPLKPRSGSESSFVWRVESAVRRFYTLIADTLSSLACKLGWEGIVSKRLGSLYRAGRSQRWLKIKERAAPAVRREAEEDWAR